jgi:hypothetical protein
MPTTMERRSGLAKGVQGGGGVYPARLSASFTFRPACRAASRLKCAKIGTSSKLARLMH